MKQLIKHIIVFIVLSFLLNRVEAQKSTCFYSNYSYSVGDSMGVAPNEISTDVVLENISDLEVVFNQTDKDPYNAFLNGQRVYQVGADSYEESELASPCKKDCKRSISMYRWNTLQEDSLTNRSLLIASDWIIKYYDVGNITSCPSSIWFINRDAWEITKNGQENINTKLSNIVVNFPYIVYYNVH
jgi:hypothetical protein